MLWLWLVSLQLITEQASFTLPRSADIQGSCASSDSEIHISWKNKAYTLRIYFSEVGESAHEHVVHAPLSPVLTRAVESRHQRAN